MRNGKRLEFFAVFLKIGALGFGIAAIWGLIQAEVQAASAAQVSGGDSPGAASSSRGP